VRRYNCAMPPATNPVFANVAVLRIPEFNAKSVSDQATLKELLERAARESLGSISVEERIVLDAEDGLAVVLFGDPARALGFAQSFGRGMYGLNVQAGVNHGPADPHPTHSALRMPGKLKGRDILLVADEEKKIRKDPIGRTTSILKKVFGILK